MPVVDDSLPVSLRDAVRIEYRRTVQWPYETVLTLSLNALLVVVGWYFMPPWIEDLMFSNHQPMAFAVVMAVWMYSDVPSTNQPGSDSERFLAALGDPELMRRLLWARRFVLWSIVTPVAAIASVWIGYAQDRMMAAMFALAWLVIAPFGVLAISPLLGVRWPYHPITLRERWSHRSQWRRFGVRWGILVVAPYAWVPALGAVLTIPAVLVWGGSTDALLPHEMTVGRFAAGTAVGLLVTLIAMRFGRRAMARFVARRRHALERELADPDLG